MRTRIALVSVFIAVIITITTTSTLIRPTNSTSGPDTSSAHSSITHALRLVAFDSLNQSRSHPLSVSGLGTALSLDAGSLAASTVTTAQPTPLAAPAPVVPTPAPVVPTPAPVVPTPAPAPVVPVTDATSTDTPDWACIRIHESGDRYHDPSAPSGAYGIIPITWESNGYSGWPYQAPAAVQDALALELYNEFGWQPWSTRFACGL